MLGWHGDKPVHVEVADNTVREERIVTTVWEPDPNLCKPGFQWGKP